MAYRATSAAEARFVVFGRGDDAGVSGPGLAVGGGADALRGLDEPLLCGEQFLPGGEPSGNGRGLLDGLGGEVLAGLLRRTGRDSAECGSDQHGTDRDCDAPNESVGA